MATSHIDSNEYSKGLQKALQVRGDKQAPNEMNVDQVMVTADAVQGGFSIASREGFSESGALPSAASDAAFLLISPITSGAGFARDHIRNNAEWDTRILFFQFTASGFGTSANNFELTHTFTHIKDGNIVQVEAIQQIIDEKPDMNWCFPMFSREETGSHQQFIGSSWNGRLPPGIDWTVTLNRQGGTNFGASKNYEINVIWERVPRGARLPL
jgi:hypothetical protein